MLEAGRVRTILLMTNERHPNFPDVPSAKEAGLDWVYENWFALSAPKGVPADRRKILFDAAERTMKREDVRKGMADRGITPVWDTPAELQAYVKTFSERGNGVLNRLFHGWAPYKGAIQGRRQGVLISMENGVSVAYALWNLEERGKMFIGAQEQIYTGMVIGEHSRDNDLEVNPLKGKKLTNVRASGTDEAVRLTPPVRMSLEEAIAYIDDDELVEVTPKNIRLRKRYLDPHERKRQSRADS